jgi:uncharacterized protein
MTMADAVGMHEISVSSGGRLLPGCVFEPARVAPASRGILFVHGQSSNQKGYEQRARSASNALGAVCLTFDLSGHGDDAGNYNRYCVYEHLDDVVAAYNQLASHPSVDRTRLGVCGASYGAYLCALLTSRRSVKRLILRAPALAGDVRFPSDRHAASSAPPDGFDSLQLLARYGGEVLIVESEKDEVIPRTHIAAHLHACPRAQHEVIPGATHALTDPGWDALFVASIVRWFRDL